MIIFKEVATSVDLGDVGGAGTSFLGYAGSWSSNNTGDLVEGYKKVSKLEDSMGKLHS